MLCVVHDCLRVQLLAAMGITDRGRLDTDHWVAIACYLALHGADISIRNDRGKTPLMLIDDERRAATIRAFAQSYREKQ